MSATITPPPADQGLASWFDRIKDAFGFGPGAPGEPAPEPIPTRSQLTILTKTFMNIRAQPPEQALRPLQVISDELAAAGFAMADFGAALSPDAAKLKQLVDRELAQLGAKAAGIADVHLREWQAGVAALPAGGEDADAKAARALAIQQLLAKIEPGIARDRYMLRQCGAPTAPLDALAGTITDLKTEYQTLLPTRETTGAPQPLPKLSKPDIKGDLTKPQQEKLTKAMTDTQSAMAKDEPPDIGVVEEAVGLIATGIDPVRAKKTLQDLKTWDAVKQEYRCRIKDDPLGAKAFMAEMWWFRRMTVDGLMAQLQRQYGFVWGSVGSDNPESDYDLTVRTHGTDKGETKWDYQIVEEANQALSKDFGGTAPGILFDTNLYAEAAAAPLELTGEQARDPTVQAMSAMKEQGQDVGALMKLRRYMEWDEYEDYKTKVLEGITGQADRALVQRQFAEADSLFFVARAEQLKEANEQNPGMFPDIDKIPLTPEGQKRLLEFANQLEHEGGKAMAANNAIYCKKLDEARSIEKSYKAEGDPAKKAALLARLKTYQADATFFAAEAYHSEGPLQHVVKAGQSSKLEIEGDGKTYTPEQKAAAIERRKQEKLAALSPNQMLQSFNENLGDLLKDLRHYASEPFPGLGFYRASKYIERLCDAFAIIGPKLPEANRRDFAALTIGDRAPAAVQALVAGLVDIRGEKTGFAQTDGVPADPEAEKQAYAIAEMKRIFPRVTTLPDLARVISDFGQRVNTAVRSAITASMRASTETPYFPT